eukprot:scaffold10977_cov82-Skeletonema_dohrnii-CCMP3373.AAC.1
MRVSKLVPVENQLQVELKRHRHTSLSGHLSTDDVIYLLTIWHCKKVQKEMRQLTRLRQREIDGFYPALRNN